MIPLTLAEVARAVGGRIAGGADPRTTVTGGVEYDSRKVSAGGLFVAFPGERVDGHDFAAAAIGQGAVAVLATREVGVPAIVVADPQVAMGTLARAVVDRLPALDIVGLTGSSGKTSTKDMIGQLATELGPTVAPAGTFNNELGHPHTALQVTERTRYLVLEMGSRGPGHIRYLCGIAPPRIGVVLNVGAAHLGEFGSLEVVARSKGELVENLPAATAGGVAVLNADDARVAAMAERTKARVVLVGESDLAEVQAREVQLDERERASYQLVTPEAAVAVKLAMSGRHQVANTLAAAAVARELGMPPPAIASTLGTMAPVSARRMDVFDRNDGIAVIDDSYNANPSSMAAALHALAGIGVGQRTWAVLGYMAELGDHEQSGHEEMGRLAATLGIDRLVVVDRLARGITEGARAAARQAHWGGEAVEVPDQRAAIALLRSELRPGDVVLVKGSRYRTWDVADALREGAGELSADALRGGAGVSAEDGDA